MLQIRCEDRIAILRIDRPERRNAIGTELVESLRHAFVEFNRDPAIGALVIEASPPGFCAGSDLKELAGMNLDGMRRHEAAAAAMARSIGLLDKPVIAAVEGFALGGGFILA
ncbi:MAG: enoyl-CoA hydratase/isomerase family protein, partial [Acetobacteraceae bacterium]